MDRTEALERARKLLALGESENEHEAALALARAQVLLERHEIELAELEGSSDSAESDALTEGSWDSGSGSTSPKWKLYLASALAKANGCTLFYAGSKITVCGRQSDVRNVARLWAWMVPEIDRITRKQCAGKGRSYANSFRVGCSLAIRDAIRKERDALREAMRGTVSETALTVVDRRVSVAQSWMQSRHRLGRGSTGRVGSSEGFAAGQSAGADVYVEVGE